MRRRRNLRESRRVHAAVGALVLGVPPSAEAIAVAKSSHPDPGYSSTGLTANVEARRVGYGRDVVLAGWAGPASAGRRLLLQFDRAGSAGWRAVASTTVRGDGRYRLEAPLRRSGAVRVVGDYTAAATSGLPFVNATTAGGDSLRSAPERVVVSAALRVHATTVNELAGYPIDVRGRLLPAVAGRTVRLQGRARGRWQTLAVARTGRLGRFDLRYVPGAVGRQSLRVRFDGDYVNGRSAAGAGTVTVYRQSVASWYDDAGTTGCGFHAHYGVANRDLPCGTRVTFFSDGRAVRAVVDDRGPYVGGRDWDLNQNTAAALGVDSVATVWSSA